MNPSPKSVGRRTALALGIGALGAAIGLLINMPLALLLGPLATTLVAALAGVPVGVPENLRTAILTVLGLFLASKFTPDVLESARHWPLSAAMVPVYIVVGGGVAWAYLRRVVRMDRVSAVFAAVPGGLVPMIVIGTAYGGDEGKIATAHALRIALAVFVLAFALAGQTNGLRDPVDMLLTGMDADPLELLFVLALAALGNFAGGRLGLVAPQIFGPVIFVAPLYLGGVVAVDIPGPLLGIGLWVMGSALGSRFQGYKAREIARLSAHMLVTVLLLLLVSAGVALLLNITVGMPFLAALLAFAPGGLAEMSLIALALHLDPAFVVVHHVLRVGISFLLAPVLGRYFRKPRSH
ncbi:MAG: AbrB family transcriptional regulator [Gammaproteobacteria bacterium]